MLTQKSVNMSEETLEETVFKTLSHQKRRDILRVIGEKKQATFTEIKNNVEVPDTVEVSYHLNALGTLVIQKDSTYSLSDLGRNAYSLICKTQTYSASNSTINLLRKEITIVIIANAILWAAAILATSEFEGRLQGPTFSLAALWFISNIILYAILRTTRKSRAC